MREIKFRAWNIPTKQFRYYPSLGAINMEDSRNIELQNTDWMQFTGLRDKDEKEIYEGDIIKCMREQLLWKWPEKDRPFVVDWMEATGFYPFNQDASLAKDCEVIGNIYENPELLTNEQ